MSFSSSAPRTRTSTGCKMSIPVNIAESARRSPFMKLGACCPRPKTRVESIQGGSFYAALAVVRSRFFSNGANFHAAPGAEARNRRQADDGEAEETAGSQAPQRAGDPLQEVDERGSHLHHYR